MSGEKSLVKSLRRARKVVDEPQKLAMSRESRRAELSRRRVKNSCAKPGKVDANPWKVADELIIVVTEPVKVVDEPKKVSTEIGKVDDAEPGKVVYEVAKVDDEPEKVWV